MSSNATPGPPPAGRSRARAPLRWIAIGLGVLVLAAALAAGLLPRLSAKEELKKQARELNVPTVAVIQPKRGEATQELVLPGNIEAYVETPIYARTNGYLTRWLVDIGARVKAGQLLAEIETPEVDDQLQQVRAELASAQANYQIAAKTATRWNELSQTGNVSKQDADQANSTMQARLAAVESARFNVARLEKLQAFKRIYAPFSGVITARNVDVGRAHRCRRRGEPGAVPHRPLGPPARLHSGAAGLLARGGARRRGRADARRSSPIGASPPS